MAFYAFLYGKMSGHETKVLHKQFDNENYGTTTRYDKHINTHLTYHRPYDLSFAVGL
jgi:hypothetical protein